jgi:hypothetical protein
MDTKTYQTDIVIKFGTIGKPDIVVMLNDQVVHSGSVPTTLTIHQELAPGDHVLQVIHQNKDANDPSTEVQIQSITLNGIQSPKFVWEGTYCPVYPESWAGQQRSAGIELPQTLSAVHHLGWNGTWSLHFTAPIFTWIHHVEDLGWIHPC